ncbi:pirin family protein [Teredinibacter waterburyi]|uniref:pirin family protein n=1 Tax=Teredinibacter waterburyi TaxID=1500538 RepID=UPI00165F1F76|nr:pirin family protein [Teredinibacter waterburyi]
MISNRTAESAQAEVASKGRRVEEQIVARATSDGANVKLLRVFGGQGPERFDPFLMLDEFGSETADDYIGGFPPHPHRGFQTVTYMLQGKMEHRDHMGNVGLLNDGAVQWMNAGSGIIHSEMPKQTEGKMRGFQIWLNLLSGKKMSPAYYKDIQADLIPEYLLEGVYVKAIAGEMELLGSTVKGYFSVEDTDAQFMDIHLQPGFELSVPVSSGYTALVYTYDGEVTLTDKYVPAKAQTLSRLVDGDNVLVSNASDAVARVVVLAGKPLREPIVQHGPFVMNSVEEINQAIADYNAGTLAES